MAKHHIQATAPFFPPGVTVSVHCQEWEVEATYRLLETLAKGFETKAVGGNNAPEENSTPEVKPAMEIHEGILKYAKSWGESWAEDSVIERAKTLYSKLGNWDMVYQELLKQDGEDKS